MPDLETQEAAPESATNPAEQSPAQQPETPKPTETVEFWKQKAREQETRAKANADAARKLQEIEDRDLSELDRAKKQAAESAAELESLRRTSLQQQVALDKGIPADLVSALNGSTVEELAAHADRLLAWRGTPAPTPAPQPRPDQGQGQGLDPAAITDAEFTQHMQHLRPTHR
jgi:small-conductance mechanosensitive channel